MMMSIGTAEAGVAIMTNAPGDRAFPPILRLRAAALMYSLAMTTYAMHGAPTVMATYCNALC
jgi:hypothetical protein